MNLTVSLYQQLGSIFNTLFSSKYRLRAESG